MALVTLTVLATIATLSIVATVFLQQLVFHPLAKYPGPISWRISRLPYMLAFRSGKLAHKIKAFHEKYGEIVRLAPNELSFTNPDALRDIYAKRDLGGPTKAALPKDPVRFPPAAPGQPVSILDALDEDHARIRKAWAPAFSSAALSAQESLVAGYVKKLITKLHLASAADFVDLQLWFNYCTFDIIGALSFAEDFGCLEREEYHAWVAGLVYSIKAKVQIAACRFYPWLYSVLLRWTTSPTAKLAMAKHMAMAREKVMTRIAKAHDPADKKSDSDFLGFVLRRDLSDAEIVTNSATMIFGGSHTLQTSLSGIIFFLLQNPLALSRLSQEIRNAFSSEDHMTMRRLAEIEYLDSCIQESLRMISPVPLNMTRQVPTSGASVAGELLPSGTIVGYATWAANYSPRNFARPDEFLPERWTESNFLTDLKEAHVPFLLGPRDCVGQNLARMEILLIIGQLLYNFDVSYTEAGPERLKKWEDQETYAVWARTPLPVKLAPVKLRIQ